MKKIEWLGFILGFLGAYILSEEMNPSWFVAAFVFFLLSNFCWMAYAIQKKSFPLLAMQLCFMYTSINGIITHSR